MLKYRKKLGWRVHSDYTKCFQPCSNPQNKFLSWRKAACREPPGESQRAMVTKYKMKHFFLNMTSSVSISP